MKKKAFVIIHLLVLVAVLLCSCLDRQPETATSEKEGVYPKTAIVDRVEDNNIVVCVDCDENVWTFKTSVEWEEGDIVSMIMGDNGTPHEFKDDTVIVAEYGGTVKGLQ